jgi:hypothetical protein
MLHFRTAKKGCFVVLVSLLLLLWDIDAPERRFFSVFGSVHLDLNFSFVQSSCRPLSIVTCSLSWWVSQGSTSKFYEYVRTSCTKYITLKGNSGSFEPESACNCHETGDGNQFAFRHPAICLMWLAYANLTSYCSA